MTGRSSLNRLKHVVKAYTEADDILAAEEDSYFSTILQSKKKSNKTKKRIPHGGIHLSQTSALASSPGVSTEDGNAGGFSGTRKETEGNGTASSSLVVEESACGVCVDEGPQTIPKSDPMSAITTTAVTASATVVLPHSIHVGPSSVTSPVEYGNSERSEGVPRIKDKNSAATHPDGEIDHRVSSENEEEGKEMKRRSLDHNLLRKQMNTQPEERRKEEKREMDVVPSKTNDRTSEKKGHPDVQKPSEMKCDLLDVLLCCDSRLLNISVECRRRFGTFAVKEGKQRRSRNENIRRRETEEGAGSSTSGDRGGQGFSSGQQRLSPLFFSEHPSSYFPPCSLATPNYHFWPAYKMYSNGKLALRCDPVPKPSSGPSSREGQRNTPTVTTTDDAEGKTSSSLPSATNATTPFSSASSLSRYSSTGPFSEPLTTSSRPPSSFPLEKKKKEFYMKRTEEEAQEQADLDLMLYLAAQGLQVEWTDRRYRIPFLLLHARECKVNGFHLEEQAFLDMALYEVGMMLETCKAFEFSGTWKEREILYSSSTERIFEALQNGAWSAIQRGCSSTAFELSRLLLSLHRQDPAGVLLSLDYMALRAKKWSWLLQICDQAEAIVFQSSTMMPGFPASFFPSAREPIWHGQKEHKKLHQYANVCKLTSTVAHRLCSLPGFAFGAAMACYLVEKDENVKGNKSGVSVHRDWDPNCFPTPTASVREQEPTTSFPPALDTLCSSLSTPRDSVNRLRKALLRFPLATVALVEALGGWNSLLASASKRKEKENREREGKEMLDTKDATSSVRQRQLWDLIQLAANSLLSEKESQRVTLRVHFPCICAASSRGGLASSNPPAVSLRSDAWRHRCPDEKETETQSPRNHSVPEDQRREHDMEAMGTEASDTCREEGKVGKNPQKCNDSDEGGRQRESKKENFLPSFSASSTQNEGVPVPISSSAPENGCTLKTERCESFPLYYTNNDDLAKKENLLKAIVNVFVHQNLPLWKAFDFRFVLCDILQEYVDDVDTTTHLPFSSSAYVHYDPGTFGGTVDVFSDSKRKEAQLLYEYVLLPSSLSVFRSCENYYLKAEKNQFDHTSIDQMQAALSVGEQ